METIPLVASDSVHSSVWVCGSYLVYHFVGTELHCAPPVCLSVCLSVWVCETYIVHYHNGARLCCAPPTQDQWSHGSRSKVMWVKVKYHMGQGQIRIPNKGRWAQVASLIFLCFYLYRQGGAPINQSILSFQLRWCKWCFPRSIM